MEPIGQVMKKTPLEFAKIMIKKEFKALADIDFELIEKKSDCPTCKENVMPEYWVKRPEDAEFNKLKMAEMDCLKCQNKKLAVDSVERSKRLKSEYLTDQFWIIPPELENATIKNYKPEDPEQAKALQRVVNYVKEYKAGERYNILLRGTYGGGKSHLLKGAADVIRKTTKVDDDGHNVPITVGYLSMKDLGDMIKGTYGRREGQTALDIVRNVIALDFLVIDDIGTESGAWIGTEFFAIINGRQGKPTAYTSNFTDMDELAKRYELNGGKIISRLHNNTEIVDVISSVDMRKKNQRGAY